MEAYELMGYTFIFIILFVGFMAWYDNPRRKRKYKMSTRTKMILMLKTEIMACRSKGDFITAMHLKKKLEEIK